MIDPALLPLLRCPATGQSLTPLPAEAATALRARIAAGGAVNQGGKEITAQDASFLLREDGMIAYPVREGIPLLLVEEGIAGEWRPLDKT